MLLKIYQYDCCLLSMIWSITYIQQLIRQMSSICFIYIIVVRLTRSSTDIISSSNIGYNHNVYIFVIFSRINVRIYVGVLVLFVSKQNNTRYIHSFYFSTNIDDLFMFLRKSIAIFFVRFLLFSRYQGDKMGATSKYFAFLF